MALSRAERTRIADNRMKIRSAADSLSQIDPSKIEDFEAIHECLESADKNLAGALASSERPDNSRRN